MTTKRNREARRQNALHFSSFVARQQGGAKESPDTVIDRAAAIPGAQLNNPDETAAAGVHSQPIFPQHRGGDPR